MIEKEKAITFWVPFVIFMAVCYTSGYSVVSIENTREWQSFYERILMKKSSILTIAALMLSVSLTQAHTTGQVAAGPLPQPTIGSVFEKDVYYPWAKQDALKNAIEARNEMEVERIISSSEFTQAEKDRYLTLAQENITLTKPGLQPDMARLTSGVCLTTVGAALSVYTLFQNLRSFGGAISDYRDARKEASWGYENRASFLREIVIRLSLIDQVIAPAVGGVSTYYGLKF